MLFVSGKENRKFFTCLLPVKFKLLALFFFAGQRTEGPLRVVSGLGSFRGKGKVNSRISLTFSLGKENSLNSRNRNGWSVNGYEDERRRDYGIIVQ